MDVLQVLLLGIGVPAATTLAVIAGLRWISPLFTKLVGGVLKTRAELDADRDRIIEGLRGEIGDWSRRYGIVEARAKAAEAQASSCAEEVHRLNDFIDTLLGRLGTSRAAVEAGEPIALPRSPRRRT